MEDFESIQAFVHFACLLAKHSQEIRIGYVQKDIFGMYIGKLKK